MKLGAPVPHFDQCALERAAAEQRRIGLQHLEIAADGDRFGDHGAIVKHERRHPLHRIDRGIGGRALLQFAEIDLLGRNLDPLFGQKICAPAADWGRGRRRKASSIASLSRLGGRTYRG